MEYCSLTLRSLINKKAVLPAELQLSFCYDIASALLYLSTLSPPILHRDLKSANIVVDSSMRCKLIDFGLSSKTQAQSMMMSQSFSNSSASVNSIVGTCAWMAPEILLAEGPPVYTPQCDVYSFGVVCWELVTCRIPFEELHIPQIAIRVTQGRSPEFASGDRFGAAAIAHSHPALLQLIEKCLKHDPLQRPSVRDIVSTLHSLLPPGFNPVMFASLIPPSDAAKGESMPSASASLASQPKSSNALPQFKDRLLGSDSQNIVVAAPAPSSSSSVSGTMLNQLKQPYKQQPQTSVPAPDSVPSPKSMPAPKSVPVPKSASAEVCFFSLLLCVSIVIHAFD